MPKEVYVVVMCQGSCAEFDTIVYSVFLDELEATAAVRDIKATCDIFTSNRDTNLALFNERHAVPWPFDAMPDNKLVVYAYYEPCPLF